MFFETARLYTREIANEDLIMFCEMQSNPNVMKYIIGKPKTLEENHEEFRKIQASYQEADNQFLIMAVVDKQNNQFIGTCAVIGNEIGYRLNECYWGNGFGKEILEGLIQFCFKIKALDHVTAIVSSKNTASVRILDHSKLHFVEEYADQYTGDLERRYELSKFDKDYAEVTK